MGSENPNPSHPSPAKFDQFADRYTALHQQSIAASGESTEYFAEYKIGCLERWLGAELDRPILDYGCGIGSLTKPLSERFRCVHGYDPSKSSLEHARLSAARASFFDHPSLLPDDYYGVVVMSGVLHHVPLEQRRDVLKLVISKLRPGDGRLVVFEHNPLNPLTRRAVAQCPFDDDAILLWPRAATKLLTAAGLQRVSRRFIVFFPRALAMLRRFEPRMVALPLGAQMMLVGTRPATS
ncbi:MAG TPA: methyltransferase domain-containing protein [Polyangiaceae bacterium]|jgi:2-polyprenyl-3-methyl-5-hydroxy-6-metoxy-1,4-benzoquinol methylase